MVTSLEMCVRNERTLVLSASSDCSVGLWDIYGNQIGTFGQVRVCCPRTAIATSKYTHNLVAGVQVL